MSRSLRIASALLLCVLPTMGCSTSAFPVKRDPPPAELLVKPEEPRLAPAGADDVAKAEERLRFGVAYRKLEQKFEALVCWALEQPSPCKPTEQRHRESPRE